MGNLKDGSPMDMRAALNFLIVDETEAIAGYDRVLARDDLNPEHRVKLERIRNAEIDHIKDLSDMYQAYSNANIVGTDSATVKGGSVSVVKDYSARGSFNSIVELRSHYPNASLRLKNDGVTVVLKSGAELEYSFIDGGRLVFIRGKEGV